MSIYQNIYCDESCHLPADGSDFMVLGALSCPSNKAREVSLRIRDIKRKHCINLKSEIKWVKVSPSNADFFRDIIDYYFDDDDLKFRAVIATSKNQLNHNLFNQDHDSWYYKMYFVLLNNLLDPNQEYRIFLDIKDTKGQIKVDKLQDVLRRTHYDFNRNIIKKLQLVSSSDTPCLQISDLLIGAISSHVRQSISNEGKKSLIERVKQRSYLSLDRNTLLKESKMNLFFWEPKRVRN